MIKTQPNFNKSPDILPGVRFYKISIVKKNKNKPTKLNQKTNKNKNKTWIHEEDGNKTNSKGTTIAYMSSLNKNFCKFLPYVRSVLDGWAIFYKSFQKLCTSWSKFNLV